MFLQRPTPPNFLIFHFLIFQFMALFLLSAGASAQSVTVAPESVVVYEASDDSNSWQGQAPVESVELSLNPEDLRGSSLTVTLEPRRVRFGQLYPRHQRTAHRL